MLLDKFTRVYFCDSWNSFETAQITPPQHTCCSHNLSMRGTLTLKTKGRHEVHCIVKRFLKKKKKSFSGMTRQICEKVLICWIE